MDYLRIAKPHVVALFLLTVLAAMLVAGRPPLAVVIGVLFASALTIGGSAALNNELERDVDATMERTRGRPTASGAMPPARAGIFGGAAIAAGVASVWAVGGPLAAAMAAAGAFYYVVVYTVLIKPHTALSSLPGGLAGVFPILIGWAAAGAGWSGPILFLCLFIVVWSPPHFWALSLARMGDYRASGIPTPALRYGEATSRRMIVGGIALLLALSLAPVLIGAMGYLYLAVAVTAGAGFLVVAARLERRRTPSAAWAVHKASGLYLGAMFVAVVADHLLRAPAP